MVNTVQDSGGMSVFRDKNSLKSYQGRDCDVIGFLTSLKTSPSHPKPEQELLGPTSAGADLLQGLWEIPS